MGAAAIHRGCGRPVGCDHCGHPVSLNCPVGCDHRAKIISTNANGRGVEPHNRYNNNKMLIQDEVSTNRINARPMRIMYQCRHNHLFSINANMSPGLPGLPGPSLGQFGRFRPNFGRDRATNGQFERIWGNCWSNFGPRLVEARRARAKFGRVQATFAQFRANVGKSWAGLGRILRRRRRA